MNLSLDLTLDPILDLYLDPNLDLDLNLNMYPTPMMPVIYAMFMDGGWTVYGHGHVIVD